MMKRRDFMRATLAGGLTISSSVRAYASPEATSIVVPHEAGGGMDVLARRLAIGLGSQGLAPVVVLNRPGASGLLGSGSVARSRNDGYTLLFNGVGHLTSPLFHAEKHYEPLEDFHGVMTVGKSPNVLMVHGSPAGDAERLVRSAGRDDAYASSGIGSTPHLAGALFVSRHGLSWLHVPYKGTGPALRALMAGEVRWMFAPSSSAIAAAKGGRVRALAVAHPRRLASLPEVPTLREVGLGDLEMSQWYGLFAPTGTPRSRLATLAAAARQASERADFRAFLDTQAIEPFFLELRDMDEWLRREYQSLRALVATLNPASPQ